MTAIIFSYFLIRFLTSNKSPTCLFSEVICQLCFCELFLVKKKNFSQMFQVKSHCILPIIITGHLEIFL